MFYHNRIVDFYLLIYFTNAANIKCFISMLSSKLSIPQYEDIEAFGATFKLVFGFHSLPAEKLNQKNKLNGTKAHSWLSKMVNIISTHIFPLIYLPKFEAFEPLRSTNLFWLWTKPHIIFIKYSWFN